MTARVPLAGVIGAPVAHSLSPRLHGFWLRRMRLAGHYVPLEVAADDLAAVLAAMPRMGFVGANVTIPHKERALDLADTVTERAASVGAANTLVFGADGRIEADNTDGYGFLQNMRAGAPGWRADAGAALVFGAGGAARAIVAALIDAGTPEIRLTNRTRARAEALAAAFGARVTVVDWSARGRAADGAATLVNTTSLGMSGRDDLTLPEAAWDARAVATDLVYTPLATGFLRDAATAGCRTVDGLGMLIWQAVPGFERWFGARPEVDAATRDELLA